MEETKRNSNGRGLVRRNHKDELFRMIFSDKENLLSLYNAISGTRYTDTEELKVVTLEDVIYMSMKNDVAFIYLGELCLFEHQSEPAPNMPLRDLLYVAREYEGMFENVQLHSTRPLKVPNPRFYVFYNGIERMEEQKILKLSDMYIHKEEEPSLELKVVFLNINYGQNREIVTQCRKLEEYSLLIHKLRIYQKDYSLEEAVSMAMDACIREGILADLLRKQRNEVENVLLTTYDEEAVRRMWKEECYEDGYADGREEGRTSKAEETAKRMLAAGKLSPEEIAEYTGLLPEQVLQLKGKGDL